MMYFMKSLKMFPMIRGSMNIFKCKKICLFRKVNCSGWDCRNIKKSLMKNLINWRMEINRQINKRKNKEIEIYLLGDMKILNYSRRNLNWQLWIKKKKFLKNFPNKKSIWKSSSLILEIWMVIRQFELQEIFLIKQCVIIFKTNIRNEEKNNKIWEIQWHKYIKKKENIKKKWMRIYKWLKTSEEKNKKC